MSRQSCGIHSNGQTNDKETFIFEPLFLRPAENNSRWRMSVNASDFEGNQEIYSRFSCVFDESMFTSDSMRSLKTVLRNLELIY